MSTRIPQLTKMSILQHLETCYLNLFDALQSIMKCPCQHVLSSAIICFHKNFPRGSDTVHICGLICLTLTLQSFSGLPAVCELRFWGWAVGGLLISYQTVSSKFCEVMPFENWHCNIVNCSQARFCTRHPTRAYRSGWPLVISKIQEERIGKACCKSITISNRDEKGELQISDHECLCFIRKSEIRLTGRWNLDRMSDSLLCLKVYHVPLTSDGHGLESVV